MQNYHITPSTQIYMQQIDNYIQTGSGYNTLRVLLLKELNQIDSQNHSSDETLVPTLMQNLRRKLLMDSSQQKSRTIDVLEDVITYADEAVESYVTSQHYCITLHTIISYKIFNPFTKAIFDQNRLRLLSIVLYYQNKFQYNQNKYHYVCKIFRQSTINYLDRQLKEKGFIFPEKTYIIVPKVNQFKPKLSKKTSQKSVDSDKVGVTFDSIIEFVNDCQKQFNINKNSCANTQFVRALKVKAKTLYDLSQNTQGLDLSAKQKQHAKQLYKQIRTMLKQIEKISEQKIKQQKIKNEKQFTEEKMQHMTPKKKDKQGTSGQKQAEMGDLLGNVIIPVNQIVVTKTPSSLKKVSSLLDDNNNDDEFSDFVSGNVQELSSKKSTSSHSKEDGLKPLKKPPKYEDSTKNDNLIQITDTLIETVPLQQSTISPTKALLQKKQPSQLIETIADKSPYSKKSIHSSHSQKEVKLIEESEIVSPSNNKMIDFQNQQHFSRFQVVNVLASKIMDTNSYNVIPHDIDFSDSSSQSANRVTFDVNKDQHFFDDKHNNNSKEYDKGGYLTPKKQSSERERVSEHQVKSQKDFEKLSSSANYQKQPQQQSQLVVNMNFGILADVRQVKAYDYSNVQNVHLERSTSNVSQEEEKRINLTPQSIKLARDPKSMNELSPSGMDFNWQEKKEKHQQLSGGKEDDDFEQYQEQVEQTLQVKEIKKESLIDRLVSKLQQNDDELLTEHSPQKGGLIRLDESPISKNEPLL